MNKNALAAILDDLRTLILKSRPAYRDYLGENVEHKAIPILTDVVLPEGGDYFLPEDSTFSGFSAGKTYHVTLDGKEFDVIAIAIDGSIGISNVSASDVESGTMPSDMWSVGTSSEFPAKVACGAYGSFVGKTISVRSDKIVVESKWSVKKLAYELLPDRLLSDLKEMMEKLSSQIKSSQVDPVFTGSFSQNRMPGTDIGYASHAEGYNTTASYNACHAEGGYTTANGYASHAEGSSTTASGYDSHAEGSSTTASGYASHAEGYKTTASADYQHVEGLYNIDDGANGDKLHIVGNGTVERRSNAHTLDKSGNAWYSGDIYVGSTSGTNRDAGSKKLATEEYVDSRLFTFTITPTNGPGSQMLSATRAEMLAALDAGKTLLGYWTETRTILETTDTIKHEFRLESVSGTGADRGLAFVNYEQFYKSTLYVNGNDTVSFVDKEVLPAPMTKTEAMTQSVGMDNDGRLWTEPGASGGGGVQSDWNQNDDTQPDYIKNKPLIVIPFKPAGKSYLTFSSPNSFNLAVENATKHWDGTLEYFSSNKTWTTWDGTSTLSAIADDSEYVLYLRGTGNTVITGNGIKRKWVLTGSDIACIGNIENLLDYATVKSGEHPTMANSCYYNMFSGCTSLTQAPALPATTLADNCYNSMFSGCTSLTQTPALPATTLATNCYYRMFYSCTSLKLSSTQTGEYTQEYRIPSSGEGVTATDALKDMFTSTGGTFTGTPEINTTYYLSSDNIIIRETEIATLNGYVGAMIDVAIDKYADTAEYIILSSTQGSTKKFKITVDDSGTISATEVT